MKRELTAIHPRPDVKNGTICERCKRKLGYPFYGLKDTYDGEGAKERLMCQECGESFMKWWKIGKR